MNNAIHCELNVRQQQQQHICICNPIHTHSMYPLNNTHVNRYRQRLFPTHRYHCCCIALLVPTHHGHLRTAPTTWRPWATHTLDINQHSHHHQAPLAATSVDTDANHSTVGVLGAAAAFGIGVDVAVFVECVFDGAQQNDDRVSRGCDCTNTSRQVCVIVVVVCGGGCVW